jgi:hypothetical protein
MILLIAASWIPEITGVSHHAWPLSWVIFRSCLSGPASLDGCVRARVCVCVCVCVCVRVRARAKRSHIHGQRGNFCQKHIWALTNTSPKHLS